MVSVAVPDWDPWLKTLVIKDPCQQSYTGAEMRHGAVQFCHAFTTNVILNCDIH